MKILLATHNKNKRKEIQELFKEFKAVEVVNLSDLKVSPPTVVEDGKSFRQNAIKKAVTVSRFYSGLVLSDDSGLEVEALDGRPGVRSARFARTKATDEENVKKLLTLMKKVPEHKRKASFVCCIALSENGILLGSYQGEVKGNILFETRGKNGFGYDPVFVPHKYEKTFAEMEGALKNKISHRAVALEKLKKAISKMIGVEDPVQQEMELGVDPAVPVKKSPIKKDMGSVKKRIVKKLTEKKSKPAVKKVPAEAKMKPAPKKAAVPVKAKTVVKKPSVAAKAKPAVKKPAPAAAKVKPAKKIKKRKK